MEFHRRGDDVLGATARAEASALKQLAVLGAILKQIIVVAVGTTDENGGKGRGRNFKVEFLPRLAVLGPAAGFASRDS